MRVLIIPIGSRGDVFPFISLGRALKERGHQVTFLTGERFKHVADEFGFDFEPIHDADFERPSFSAESRPMSMAKRFVDSVMVELMRSGVPRIRRHVEKGRTVMLAAPQAIPARIVRELDGVPLITTCLSPLYFRSSHRNRTLPGVWSPDRLPKWAKRVTFALEDRLSDRYLGGDVAKFRQELGLPPTTGLMTRWWFSPDGVMNLFPEWFAHPQPDWPSPMWWTGFVLQDSSSRPVDDEVWRFLDAGAPPVVFTLSSWMRQSDVFFRESIEACRKLGLRAVLLSKSDDPVPNPLPADVAHFGFVPHRELLPRCAAIVHPGGIGTVAHSLAAGLPQVIVPAVFDQPDNAVHLGRLGVARTVLPARYRSDLVAETLRDLLEKKETSERFSQIRQWCADAPGTKQTVETVEKIAEAAGVEST